MPSKVTIQKAELNQVQPIQELLRITWIDTYPNEELNITVTDIESKEFLSEKNILRREKQIKNQSEKSTMFVALIDTDIAGICSVLHEGNTGRIKAIYISPEHQRNGIGSKLMKTAMDWLSDSKIVKIELAGHNDKARLFYSKFGFKKNGATGSYELPTGKSFPTLEMELTQSLSSRK